MGLLLMCGDRLKSMVVSWEDVGREKPGFIDIAPILLDRVMTVV